MDQGSKAVSFMFVNDHSIWGCASESQEAVVLVQEKGGRGLRSGGLRNGKH